MQIHSESLKFAALEIRRTAASVRRALNHLDHAHESGSKKLIRFAHRTAANALRSHGLARAKHAWEIRQLA